MRSYAWTIVAGVALGAGFVELATGDFVGALLVCLSLHILFEELDR